MTIDTAALQPAQPTHTHTQWLTTQ